jgi:hypothetical protein
VYHPNVNEADMNKMKQTVSSLSKVFCGSMSAPPKGSKDDDREIPKMFEVQKNINYMEAVVDNMNLELINKAERVQGLSMDSFNESEDDLLSEEAQLSQSNQQQIKDKHHVGMVKCSNPEMHNINGMVKSSLETKKNSNPKSTKEEKEPSKEGFISKKKLEDP